MGSARRLRKSIAIASVTLLLVTTAVSVLQLPHARMNNDLATWLSEDVQEVKSLKRMRSYFPARENILVTWDTATMQDPRVEAFRENLSNCPLIENVETADELVRRMVRRRIEEAEAVDRLRGVLIGEGDMANAKVATVVTLSETGLHKISQVLGVIAAAAANADVDPAELRVDGASVTSHAVDQEVLSATWNSVNPLSNPPVFLLSAAAGILLTFVVLRSVPLGMIVTVVAWCVSLIATSLIPSTGRTLNMVTIVMPTLLVVLTISAGIHVVNYWRRARQEQNQHPVKAAIRMGIMPCLLAAATTTTGLMSLTISRLHPIRDFGWFSSIGTMLAFALVMTVLPAMLYLLRNPSQASVNVQTNRGWNSLASLLCRYHRAIIAGGIVLALVSGYGLRWLQTEVKVARYFPDDSRLLQDAHFLEDNVGGTVSLEVLVHFDKGYQERELFLERLELIRKVENAVRKHPDVTGAIGLPDFVAESIRPGSDQSTMVRLRYRAANRRTEEAIKNRDVASSDRFLGLSPIAGYAWKRDAPLDETWRVTAQTRIVSDVDYGQLSQELSAIVAALLQTDGELSNGVWYDVTGSVPVFYAAQTALLESLIQSLGLALLVISLAMMVVLKGIRAGFLSVVPAAMPIAFVFGGLSWFGQVLDIGTMLTGSVALGIAIDNILHLLTWFRKAVRNRRSRQDAVTYALQHCGAAMTQTTVVIGLSLLMLYPADLLLISRFGLVMAALLFAAWFTEIVFLPALLAGPLGRLIEHVELDQKTIACSSKRSPSLRHEPLTSPSRH